MIGVVLAAGMGRRLADPRGTPKALLEVGGASLISNPLGRFDDLGLSRIVVVLGYGAEAVRAHVDRLGLRHEVEYVLNDRYETTNNMYSLWLTADDWADGFLVSDGDLLTAPHVVADLWQVQGSGILVDRSRTTFDLGARIVGDRVRELSKTLAAGGASGEALGMSVWRPQDAQELRERMTSMLADDGMDLWYPYAISAIADRVHVSPVDVVESDWFEIDTRADLQRARDLAPSGPAWLA